MPSRQRRPGLASTLVRSGPPPEALLRTAGAPPGCAGGRVARAATLLEVVASERADRPPRRPPGGPWMWLTPAPPAPAHPAAPRPPGRMDVIDGSAPPAEVVARLRRPGAEHARRPHETPPEAPDFVAESAGRPAPAARAAPRRAHLDAGAADRRDRHRQGGGRAACCTRWSARRSRRFVPINCAAIPNEMLEAELFGYARGAFSGAVQALRRPAGGGRGRHGASSTRSTTRRCRSR